MINNHHHHLKSIPGRWDHHHQSINQGNCVPYYLPGRIEAYQDLCHASTTSLSLLRVVNTVSHGIVSMTGSHTVSLALAVASLLRYHLAFGATKVSSLSFDSTCFHMEPCLCSHNCLGSVKEIDGSFLWFVRSEESQKWHEWLDFNPTEIHVCLPLLHTIG